MTNCQRYRDEIRRFQAASDPLRSLHAADLGTDELIDSNGNLRPADIDIDLDDPRMVDACNRGGAFSKDDFLRVRVWKNGKCRWFYLRVDEGKTNNPKLVATAQSFQYGQREKVVRFGMRPNHYMHISPERSDDGAGEAAAAAPSSKS